MPFTCSICAEESIRICARCTKDSCNNHICEKCLCCSDCCECEVSLSEPWHEPVRPVVRSLMGEVHPPPFPDPDPEPEPHLPEPDPDPVPLPGDPGPVMP
jgi:hypothetical protein